MMCHQLLWHCLQYTFNLFRESALKMYSSATWWVCITPKKNKEVVVHEMGAMCDVFWTWYTLAFSSQLCSTAALQTEEVNLRTYRPFSLLLVTTYFFYSDEIAPVGLGSSSVSSGSISHRSTTEKLLSEPQTNSITYKCNTLHCGTFSPINVDNWVMKVHGM